MGKLVSLFSFSFPCLFPPVTRFCRLPCTFKLKKFHPLVLLPAHFIRTKIPLQTGNQKITFVGWRVRESALAGYFLFPLQFFYFPWTLVSFFTPCISKQASSFISTPSCFTIASSQRVWKNLETFAGNFAARYDQLFDRTFEILRGNKNSFQISDF